MYDDEEPKRKKRWWLWATIAIALVIASVAIFKKHQASNSLTTVVDSTSFATGDEVWENASYETVPLQFDEITSPEVLVKGNSEFAVYTLFPFDAGKTTLRNDAPEKLQQIAKSMSRRFANAEIRVYSFSDSTGSNEANLNLTKARAAAVRNWLVHEGGVPASAVKVFPFGESKPIASNGTPEGRHINRRIEIVASTEDPVEEMQATNQQDTRQ